MVYGQGISSLRDKKPYRQLSRILDHVTGEFRVC